MKTNNVFKQLMTVLTITTLLTGCATAQASSNVSSTSEPKATATPEVENDKTAPVITLKEDTVSVTAGTKTSTLTDTITENIKSVKDDVDGKVEKVDKLEDGKSGYVIDTSEVKSEDKKLVKGTYEVKITAQDTEGNTSSEIITLKVTKKSSTKSSTSTNKSSDKTSSSKSSTTNKSTDSTTKASTSKSSSSTAKSSTTNKSTDSTSKSSTTNNSSASTSKSSSSSSSASKSNSSSSNSSSSSSSSASSSSNNQTTAHVHSWRTVPAKTHTETIHHDEVWERVQETVSHLGTRCLYPGCNKDFCISDYGSWQATIEALITHQGFAHDGAGADSTSACNCVGIGWVDKLVSAAYDETVTVTDQAAYQICDGCGATK